MILLGVRKIFTAMLLVRGQCSLVFEEQLLIVSPRIGIFRVRYKKFAFNPVGQSGLSLIDSLTVFYQLVGGSNAALNVPAFEVQGLRAMTLGSNCGSACE